LNYTPLWFRLKSKRGRGYFANAEYEFDEYHETAWRTELLGKVLRFLRRAHDEFSNCKIVVRPHPIEPPNAWADILGEMKNVHITRDGDIHTWITNAEAVIHNGCTSGFEAAVTDTPVLSMRFVPSPCEQVVANSVGISAYNVDEAMNIVSGILDNGPASVSLPEAGRQILNDRFNNLSGRYAFETIVDAWETLVTPELCTHNDWESVVKSIQSRALSGETSANITMQHTNMINKFPGLARSEMEDLLYRYQQSLGRFSDVSISQLGTRSFVLCKKA